MRRRFVLLAVGTLLGGCATALETVYVPADSPGWKFGYGSDRRGQTIAEYVPRNESINNWTSVEKGGKKVVLAP